MLLKNAGLAPPTLVNRTGSLENLPSDATRLAADIEESSNPRPTANGVGSLIASLDKLSLASSSSVVTDVENGLVNGGGSASYCWPGATSIADDISFLQRLSTANYPSFPVAPVTYGSFQTQRSVPAKFPQQPQRRAITGHHLGFLQQQQLPSMQAPLQQLSDGSRTLSAWSVVPPSSSSHGFWSTRSGDGTSSLGGAMVQHGRSMSVQNVGLAGTGQSQRRTANGYPATGINPSLIISKFGGHGRPFPDHVQFHQNHAALSGSQDRIDKKTIPMYYQVRCKFII